MMAANQSKVQLNTFFEATDIRYKFNNCEFLISCDKKWPLRRLVLDCHFGFGFLWVWEQQTAEPSKESVTGDSGGGRGSGTRSGIFKVGSGRYARANYCTHTKSNHKTEQMLDLSIRGEQSQDLQI